MVTDGSSAGPGHGLAHGALTGDPADEAAGRAGVGDDLGLDGVQRAYCVAECLVLADQPRQVEADLDGHERCTGEVQRHLVGHPSPQFAVEGEVEGSDDADTPLRMGAPPTPFRQ